MRYGQKFNLDSRFCLIGCLEVNSNYYPLPSQSARAKSTFRLCGIYQMLVSNVGLGLGDERERGATEIEGRGW